MQATFSDFGLNPYILSSTKTLFPGRMFRISGTLALCLALAQHVSADDHAVSVSTSDFKDRFVDSGIVPEVIAALDPAVSFYAAYKAGDDDHDELLVPGSSLTVSEASMPFEFSVENLNNATNITAQTRFLIYLVSVAQSPFGSCLN